MKVVIVNTTDSGGGAAIASKRMYDALKTNNVAVNFLVQSAKQKDVISTSNNFVKKKINFFRSSLERLKIWLNINKREDLFSFDSASYGEDISKLKIIKDADIIHLNWINFGFLSVNSLEKLIKLNKPIVWTLHDMWALTGGCFHSRGCNKFTTLCENCKYLKPKSKLAQKVFSKKLKIFNKTNLYPIAISNWNKQNIENSAVLLNSPILIGNPINTDFFAPEDKTTSKQKLNLNASKFHIGFIAFNVTNEYKGGKYLIEALKLLQNTDPDLYNKIELIAIGRVKDKLFFSSELNIHFTGYINDEIVMRDYYNAMDLFVLPSLEENLPLVIQEAMSCCIPVIAFNVGGIPDLIEHKKDGYIARFKDSKDLMNGFIHMLNDIERLKEYSYNARRKIINQYSYKVISLKIITLYKKILVNN